MAHGISGSVSDAVRLIVIDETDMSIEHNDTHDAGLFDIPDLNSGSKIVLARNNDGDTYGYGNVSPIYYITELAVNTEGDTLAINSQGDSLVVGI